MTNFSVLFRTLCWSALFTFIDAGGVCRGRATCQNLRECAPVMSLIDSQHKPLKPSVVQFLRAQQCGFHDGYPKICCGVLPKTLNIFNKAQKGQKPRPPHRRQKQHNAKLNRAPQTLGRPGIAASINKMSVYQPEAANMLQPPRFDITVSTAPPGASTVPYLRNLQRDENRNGFLNTRESFRDAIASYMEHYDLQRTRRSGVVQSESDLDVEVR